MSSLSEIAEPVVETAHSVVWANVATVGRHNRPRSRILHPIWQWDGSQLTGWIGTGPTPIKRAPDPLPVRVGQLLGPATRSPRPSAARSGTTTTRRAARRLRVLPAAALADNAAPLDWHEDGPGE